MGETAQPALNRDGGILCLYAALKKGGAFQSEADEKACSTSISRDEHSLHIFRE